VLPLPLMLEPPPVLPPAAPAPLVCASAKPVLISNAAVVINIVFIGLTLQNLVKAGSCIV
jgi:hypothetical protein